MRWSVPGFACCGSTVASARPLSRRESVSLFNRCKNTSRAPAVSAPAGWRESLPCWTYRSASFSNLPGLDLPARSRRFTCSPSREPDGFSRPMPECQVRGFARASRSWLKPSPIQVGEPRLQLRVSIPSISVSGASGPRGDSRPQEDERRSQTTVQSGGPPQPVARIASRSGGLLPGMNSPIQSRRVASICQDMASAE